MPYNIGDEDFVVPLYNCTMNEHVHITMVTFAVSKIRNLYDGIATWEDYAECLQQFYLANEVANDKKVPALLSLIGPKTYGLRKT